MNTSERKRLIEQALELIEEAKDLVDEAVKGTSIEANYKAYGRFGLNTALGDGNPYDASIQDLLNTNYYYDLAD